MAGHSRKSSLLPYVAQALGMLWALPVTLPAALAGLLAMPFGAKLSRSGAALVFNSFPFGPGGALTLGNVILHTGEDLDRTALTYACRAHGGSDRVRLDDHERAHVFQYMALG